MCSIFPMADAVFGPQLFVHSRALRLRGANRGAPFAAEVASAAIET